MVAKLKRSPDAGVATAVQGIIQHQKFKRMLLFGLRSLSDFCSPSNQLYQENACDAMDRGVLPAMQTAVETFPDDEDLMTCCARILWAMSEACIEEFDTTRMATLASYGGICVAIVNSAPSDPQPISDIMTYVENMDKLGHPVDGAALGPGLLVIFTKDVPMKAAARVAAALAVVTRSPGGAAAVAGAGGVTSVLNYCLQHGDLSEPAVNCVESAFDCVKYMAENGHGDQSVLPLCISLMDKYRSKKGASTKGSAALASMVGPEQLRQCLTTLKNSAAGSPEHDEALMTLGSMSYISSFTDEIVNAGGIPMLCELINSGLAQIESNPEKIYKMIGGAAKMLARIASNPTNVDSMVQAGAVATLATAVSYCTDNLECLGALCMALTPLAARESLASEIVQYQTFATVLPLLYQHVENAEFAPLAMELVATASQHQELQAHMVENLAVEICAMCCSYHLKDTAFQANAILSLNRLAPNLTSLRSIADYNGFQGINASIIANIKDISIVQGALQLYEKLSKVSDATTYMSGTECVDAVLEAMLEHEQNETVINSGVNCLSIIATESDCNKHLSDLDMAIQTAKGDPDRAYRALAAVAGLSRVSHLRQSFEQRNAAETILRGIHNWVEGPRFEGQGRVIRAGLKTIKIIKISGDGDLTQVLVSMCDIACLPQMKRIVELEEPDDNILVHSTMAARDVAATGRVCGAENVEAAIDSIMKVMRKYSDSRRAMINCLEALNYLANCDSGGGVAVLIKTGAVNAVVQYLNKSPMYLDAQISGFTVLATCAKIDPSSAEVMKKCNVLGALKVAMRTHSKSRELKRTIAPLLALLMPVDALEREIQERIAECNEAIGKNNMVGLHEALVGLNELLVSGEGAKIAARLNVGANLMQYAGYVIPNQAVAMKATDYDLLGNDLYIGTLSEVAHAVEQMAGVRTGCINLLKNDAVTHILTMYETVNSAEMSSLSEEAALHCLEALRLMVKADKKSADVAFNRNVVATLCSGIDKYQESAPVLASTCGCLAALATTPSRVASLLAQPDFDNLVHRLIKIINEDAKRENRLVATKALRELVETCNDPSLAVKICEAGAVTALFSTIENYGDDEELVREAATTLALLGVHDDLRRFYGNDVRAPCMVLTTALDTQNNSEGAAYQLLCVLNRITTSDDKGVLKELGAMGQVSDVMRIYSDNEQILKVGGELFAKMGADEQIKSLMLQIIAAAEAADENTVATVDSLCAKLAMFLAAPLEDPVDALQHTEKCLSSLAAVLQMAPTDQRLQGNVATVSRRLCDRCFDDPNDSNGAWAVVSSGLMHQMGAMIAAGQVDSNKGFLVPGYRTLAACAANPYSMPSVLEAAPTFIGQTFSLLEAYKNDAETSGRILEFLRYFAEDATGAQHIMSLSGSSGDIVSLTQLIMQQHKNNDSVVANGMYLLGALAYNVAAAGGEPLAKIADGSVLRDCEVLCAAHPSQERLVAYSALLERLILSQSYNDALSQQKALQKLVMRVQSEEESKKLSEDERAGIFCSLCRVFMAAGSVALIADIEQSKGFELILQAVEDYPENPAVIRDSCLALAAMSACDANMASRTIKEAIPLLCAGDAANTIANNPECADAYCDLLMQLCSAEGNGRQLLAINGMEDLLNNIDAYCDAVGEAESAEIKKKTAMIRQAMADDQPHEKTCKDVYDLLSHRQAANMSISVTEVAVLQEEMDFVFSRLQMYNKEKLDANTAIGAEHQYGNMALEIFSTCPANYKALQQQDFVKMELSIIKSVKDEEIVLYAVKALSTACKNPACAQDAARTTGCPTIVTDAISRISKSTDLSAERKEEHLCARLLLLERTAVNRNLYNKTTAVAELIRCWNDYDKGLYSTTLLRHVFRAMRRIVSDAHVDELLKANVLQRLIAIIKNVEADLALLPDVLFLLGSLAVVPEIKTKIGELEGVAACYDLLQRTLPNPQATAVVTNTCLAFANICIGHKKNTEIFHKLGGPDLTVKVLNDRCTEYDVCNAASVLLCNLLYKNENMKKYLGTNGAPAALVKGVQNYDGSIDKTAIRCLESLFKAISNLSLYTPNIQPFLDAGIENAYSAWLSNLTADFPDQQLETGCRTLANLVMENDPNNMRKFGVCLLPCMQVANQGRQETKALMLLLDIEASLCRLQENAISFADNGGIETTIRIIHQFDYDVGLLTLGIHLLGIQSSVMSSIQKMVEADVFSILVGCVEVDAEGNEVTDLVVGGLRCTRRIIRTQELAFEYCNAGGIATVANVICKSINQPMVMLEACRVLLCLLALTTKPQAERAAAVQALHEAAAAAATAAGAVPDENGVIPGAEPDPEELANAAYGGWYQMGMDEVMINAIIQAVVACAGSENHAKQLRLQRVSLGVACYFVSEQMGQDSFVGSGGDLMIMQALNTFPGEASITQLSCIIINSIALTSGDTYDSIKTRELVAAFKQSIGKLPSKKPEEKAIRDECQKTLDALNSSLDPMDAFANVVTELNLDITQWNVDPYPNGVHDLPANVKDALRKGGKVKVYLGDKDAEEMRWRSSQDLNSFEWNTGAETDWNNRIPIVRIRNVAKGLAHPALIKANKKSRQVTAKVCLCIFGPPNEDFPNGIELPLRCKNQKERDQLVDMLVQWRDAATYNF